MMVLVFSGLIVEDSWPGWEQDPMLTIPSSPLIVADCIFEPRLSITPSAISSLETRIVSSGPKMPAIPVNVCRLSLAVV